MAESPNTLPQTAYQISLTYDVLPVLKMAEWVAQASRSNAEIDTLRRISPAFDKAYKEARSAAPTFAVGDPMPMLEDVLAVASRLLECVTDAHGGDL